MRELARTTDAHSREARLQSHTATPYQGDYQREQSINCHILTPRHYSGQQQQQFLPKYTWSVTDSDDFFTNDVSSV